MLSTSRSSRAVLSTSRASRAVLSTGRARRPTSRHCACPVSGSEPSFCCPGGRGGTEALTRSVFGSRRAVLSTSRSSRAVFSTGRTRRTTSRQCARTASGSEASFCCLGRRGGTEGLTVNVSRSRSAVLSPVRAVNHFAAAPALPLRFAAHRYLIVSGHVIPRFEGLSVAQFPARSHTIGLPGACPSGARHALSAATLRPQKHRRATESFGRPQHLDR